MLTQLISKSAAVALIAMPLLATAAPSSEPISQFGILGTYNRFNLKGAGLSETDSLPEGGLFYNFGNKMTAGPGLIYQAGIDLKSGKDKDDRLKDFQGDVDIGWRMALGDRDFLDVIGGGGYGRTRYTSHIDRYEISLLGRSPFLKAAMGYTHHFDSASVRLEAGVRRTTESDLKLKVNGMDIATADLKDRTNPYAEANFLFNTQGALSIAAGVYYSQTGYQLNTNNDLARKVQLQRDELGAKVGIAF
ncbi:outer membrane beta-barrel protein [Pseudomonas sp. FEN]|uniref:outer membrane beta-barrel protein n=1 Tax=Pseudomonas sp. FEN TaxID=2767468 RepID=UPI00174E4DBA|nr:outer membrane beta-barrel protein [Pseudomonas sp. FEN]